TQLAKVLPVDESASTTKSAESLATKEAGDSKSDLAASNALTNKGQATQAATQGAALKAFNEALKQPEAGTATATAEGSGATGKGAEKGAAEGSQQPATAANQGSAQVATAQSVAESAAAQSSVTTNATTPTDNAAAPVMVAPQQVLAQAESQGPQAPLSTISAGIKQMEVTGTDEVRKAVSLEVKPKAGEAEKSLVATTSSGESSPSQTVQHGQNSQTQPQVADSRAPAAETTLRREPQNLPHLKLASQEAPAELHQKVNVMLAEKLQQAEIQLDPLGLGKMKIQIQMGADSQANVHFVVQHGQTREMLEQAMPRLRDMLAGQGIQLGQTQVQQQSQQQQQQGQPTFNGQGQQGQSSGQPRSGNGLVEGELTTSNPSLLVESTNGSGIDFYA
ncbi:TPA: flagellar hook-length control protein FliK, partial [Aeromonas veronii]